jgi:hypothetical protein
MFEVVEFKAMGRLVLDVTLAAGVVGALELSESSPRSIWAKGSSSTSFSFSAAAVAFAAALLAPAVALAVELGLRTTATNGAATAGEAGAAGWTPAAGGVAEAADSFAFMSLTGSGAENHEWFRDSVAFLPQTSSSLVDVVAASGAALVEEAEAAKVVEAACAEAESIPTSAFMGPDAFVKSHDTTAPGAPEPPSPPNMLRELTASIW